MAELKAGSPFPEGVSFTYVPYVPSQADITACGVGIKYDASKGKHLSLPQRPLCSLLTPPDRGQRQEDRHRLRPRRLHPDLPGAARNLVHRESRRAQGQGRGPGCLHRYERSLGHERVGQGERGQGRFHREFVRSGHGKRKWFANACVGGHRSSPRTTASLSARASDGTPATGRRGTPSSSITERSRMRGGIPSAGP